MAAGGPGDHPLSDIVHYRIPTYGTVADDAICELSKLLSRRELYEWWSREVGWECDPITAHGKSETALTWARRRAKQSGWEVDPDDTTE